MEKNYVETRSNRKQKTKRYLWMLLGLAVIFTMIIVRFARGGLALTSTGLPDSDVAYEVAKDFVKANVRSNDVSFSNSGYQFAKKTDSIYVIRSVMESKDGNGDTKRANFKVMMQYKGGKADETRSWDLLNISED